MAKPLKIVLAIIGVLLLLIVAAAVALPLLFDPNSFRGRVGGIVHEQTGRTFEVGRIQLQVFPWLRVALADARLGNAEGFGTEPFAEIRQVGVGVKLMPLLLHRQVQVSSVKLDGLRLNLAVNKEGVGNWQDLLDRQKPAETPAPEPVQVEAKVRIEDIDIGGIAVSNASIGYRDAKAGTAYRIEPLSLEVSAFKPGKPFDVVLDLLAQAEQPAAQAAIQLGAHVIPDLKAQRFQIEKLKGTIKADGRKIADGKDASAEVTFDGDLSADLNAQRIETGPLDIRFKAQGLDLNADGRVGLALVADLAAQVFSIDGLDLAIKAAGKPLPGGSQDVKLSGTLRYDQKTGALAFDNGRVQALGLDVTTQIKGEGLAGEHPKLSGPIAIAPFSPRELLKKLDVPLDTADPKALSRASFKAQYGGSFKSATFNDFQLSLDDSTMQGRLAVSDFATQALEFALRLDAIDADRYLPPKKAEEAGKPPAQGGGDINDIKLPTEALEQLNANGTIDIGRMTINGLKLTDVRLKLSGSGKAPKTQDLTARLYGGTVNLSNRYAADGAPTFALKTSLNALSAAPFLQDLLGKDYVSGLGSVQLDLNSRGATVGELRKALNGSVAVKVENGAVKGFNLGQILRQGQALLAGQAAPTETEPQTTDFATLAASATITNGVLRTSDLAAASPAFRLAGSGQIDLANETIRFLAKPTVVETSQGQGGKGLDQLRGLTVPIEISGNLFSPKYKLDLEGVLKDKAKEQLKNQLAKELDLPKGQATEQQLKEKAAEKLGDLLFGRKKKDKQPEPTPAPAEPTPPT
ncbi:AsmA family protein [Fontimonas sp. SYSU GA230001]|uniref:AsmA family protein n=1 Tax=Fontimonas sp. SYSU GA230001 TaxID=3142450 RepID=UPI0032B50B94